MSTTPLKPLVAITSDLMVRKDRETAYLTMSYAEAVRVAGGIPIILPPTASGSTSIFDLISRMDAFILSGGDDPMTEQFGVPTHPRAVPILKARQEFETVLIEHLIGKVDTPVLGICLGMQLLALVAGGSLNQHLPDTHESHADHWDRDHSIISTENSVLPSGTIWSSHRQAVSDAANFRVLAKSHDGVIEAFDDPERSFLMGIQWHPERTENPQLGQGIFNRLIAAAVKDRS